MKLLKFFEKVLPLFFWILMIYAFGTPLFGTMTLLSAFIHELGHLIPAFRLNNSALPRAEANGFRIKLSAALSYREDTLVTLAGPLANLIASGFLFFLYFLFGKNGYIYLFAAVNLMTAISNLLPAKGYDGYRILENILTDKFGSMGNAEKILSVISRIFTVVLLFLSLFLLLKIGEGYWIFGLLFFSFMKEIKKSHASGILRE